MGTEIDAYIERLDALGADLRQAIHGMDAEEFNWAPLEADTNSPCVLATHMAGSGRFWLHQVLGGIETRRDRDAEFEAVAPRFEELKALLVAVGKQSREVLQGVSEAELARERGSCGRQPARRQTLRHPARAGARGTTLGVAPQPHQADLRGDQRRDAPAVMRRLSYRRTASLPPVAGLVARAGPSSHARLHA
jgi:hypothetical protein